MSIRFILGRAGSGKSHYVLDNIREQLEHAPLGDPIVLLVPEQATFQAEYALVSSEQLSGIIRAQALSFRRLAYRIMQETGGTTRLPIDDTGKKMMLYKTLYKHKDQLKLFQHAIEHIGFIDSLNEVLNEFKRYTISAGRLSDYFTSLQNDDVEQTVLSDKLHDLTLIYDAFETEISAEYIDAEEYLDILAEQIQYSHYIKEAEIWIDGFNGFTPQEFKVIEQLMKYAGTVHIALCVDREYSATERPDELDLFHPTATTLIQLQQMADELQVRREPTVLLEGQLGNGGRMNARFSSNPMLAHLEQYYHQRRIWRGANAGADAGSNAGSNTENEGDRTPSRHGISIHAAVNRRAEIDGVAREMIRLVRDEGYRWRDMAVMVRNADDYEDLIAMILSDYRIPFFFDQKHTVTHHPLVEFIRSALEIIQFNWQYDSVFRCIKTDFMLPLSDGEQPITRRMLDELENYVLAFGIHGYRWTDGKRWTYQRAASLEDDEVETSVKEQLYLEQINDARHFIVKPLLRFQEAMDQAYNVRDRVIALYNLLESVHAAQRLEQWSAEAIDAGDPELARTHTQMWGMVMDTLDQVVEVMGDEELNLELFAGLLETGLESIKLGLVPPSIDQVLIGSVDRTRSTRIKVSFVLGVNDGIMPAKVAENSVLSEHEREQLIESGLEIAPGSRRRLLDEQFIIYTALTTQSEHLWLSYPLADEEGKSLLPSEVIRRVKTMFPMVPTQFMMAEPLAIFDQATQMQYIAHPERALSYLIVQLREWQRGVDIDPIWWDVYNWMCSHEQWRSKMGRMLFGLFYNNQEKQLSKRTRRELYGDHLQASVSRMEKYVSCPFAQFISHGLRLKERQIFRLEAPDIGQLFHAALSHITNFLQIKGIGWGELTLKQCEQLASDAVNVLSPRLQSDILLSSKRYHYIARKLKRIIARATAVLSEHAKRGAFIPAGVELDFGINSTLPPLSFTLDNGVKMDIVGRIDRVDRAHSEQGVLLRVVDYKSSQTSLALSDVYYGLSLQVLTYLDVVVTHAETWLGQKGLPAGVLYFHVHHPLLQTTNTISQEEAESELFKQFKMRGLVLADTDVVEKMDSTLDKGHSTIIPVGLRADGSFYKNSSVIDETQWQTVRRFVRRTIKQIGTGITDGDVAIKPYRIGQRTPCTFCSYKPICQFDQQFEQNDYNHLQRMNQDEAWDRFKEEVGDDE